MFYIVMGILSLLLVVNLMNGDIEEVLLLLGIIVVSNIVKLTILNQKLSLKYSTLEERFNTLETRMKERSEKERAHMQEAVHVEEQDNRIASMEIARDTVVETVIDERVSIDSEVTSEQPETAVIVESVADEVQTATVDTATVTKTEASKPASPFVQPADPIEDAMTWLKEYFMRGNPMVKIGVSFSSLVSLFLLSLPSQTT